MNVFLTGATGFIGSHVARILIREGETVHALLRPDGNTERIADILPSLNVVTGSLTDPGSWKGAIEKIKPNLAIHLAWYAVPGEYLTSPENLRLLKASLELVEALSTSGCKRFVGAGTCFEYEADFGYLSESTPVNPKTLYAAAKLALHLVVEQIAKQSEMKSAWLRFFYLYGPYEDKRRLVAATIRALLKDERMKTTQGEQVRDFLHVEDVAAAVCAVAKSELTGAVNIGSGEPVTVTGMVEKIAGLLEKRHLVDFGALAPRPWDARFICANNRKLLEKTAWRPRYSLDQGLRETIEWWKARL